MQKSTTALAMVVLSLLTLAPAAYADIVGPVVLTPDGANTDFMLTGTFNNTTPVTAYSGPNLPWTLTFALPTNPTSFSLQVPGIDLFGIDTTVTLNGSNFPGTEVLLFGVSQQGGITVCLSTDCTNNFPPSPSFFDIFTVDSNDNYTQMYSGNVTAPTLLSGTFPVDGSQSFVAITATPEPSSLLLIGTGLLGIGINSGKRCNRGTGQ